MPRKNRPNFSNEPSVSVLAETEGEAHFLAQALDYYRAVQQAGNDAPFGQKVATDLRAVGAVLRTA